MRNLVLNFLAIFLTKKNLLTIKGQKNNLFFNEVHVLITPSATCILHLYYYFDLLVHIRHFSKSVLYFIS